MESLKTAIGRNLKDAGRVAVLAIGSPLRGDDAAGLHVADGLRRLRAEPRRKTGKNSAGRSSRAKRSALRIFIGETAPENLTGEIRKFRPTHLVILDAADMSKRPGSISLIEHETLNGTSISTHNMPVNILIQYLQQSNPCKAVIIGIQPKSHEFGRPLSAPVQKAAALAAAALAAALQ